MPCCGRGVPQGRVSAQTVTASVGEASQVRRQTRPVFEYVGATALTAIGGVTGKRYRFERPGAQLAVEPADKPSLMIIPNLRRRFS